MMCKTCILKTREHCRSKLKGNFYVYKVDFFWKIQKRMHMMHIYDFWGCNYSIFQHSNFPKLT